MTSPVEFSSHPASLARENAPHSQERPALSVVMPMYNEEENVPSTLQAVREELEKLDVPWEMVLVNDGSTDDTLVLVQEAAAKDARIRLFSYAPNRGRGHALRTGFAQARGEIIVTIDFDLSYSAEFITKLYRELLGEPALDFVIASPYMPGGETVSVPRGRLYLSKLANKTIGFALGGHFKTVTGILRGYRRQVIQALELSANGKEIHLEILSKLMALGYRGSEVPAVLRGRRRGRSKFRLGRTSLTHLAFTFFERPVIFFGMLGLILLILGLVDGVYIIILWQKETLNPERPLMTLLVLLILGGVGVFSFGFLAMQLVALRRELYILQRENRLIRQRLEQQGAPRSPERKEGAHKSRAD
jgi:glycosyltransferase involved in cell wall biosynthesis